MLFEKFFGCLLCLHGGEFEATGLETSDDLSDNSSLNSVRLDHDVCALGAHGEGRAAGNRRTSHEGISAEAGCECPNTGDEGTEYEGLHGVSRK
mmetsp:Transcript_10829/g.16130  ORF Transcript_10829/g.16130 Transcript_10829/m.16130 type:complete len:94 (-) Transcript_10829:48-329(-)